MDSKREKILIEGGLEGACHKAGNLFIQGEFVIYEKFRELFISSVNPQVGFGSSSADPEVPGLNTILRRKFTGKIPESEFSIRCQKFKTMTTQKLSLLFILFYFGLSYAFGQQTMYKSSFPEGLYRTKEDFIKKTPTEFLQLTIDKIRLVNDSDSVARRCFFIEKETNKRVKKVFAISHNGHLYFSNWAIIDNKAKSDKSVSPVESMNSFVRVLIRGDNLLYAEGAFLNPWQTGISAGVASGVGGIIGSELGNAIDKSYPITTFGGTGVVWDIKKEEFNIFRNCSDFNEFFETDSVEKIDCGKQIFELKQIREIIDKIK